jgi:hypothetical protein
MAFASLTPSSMLQTAALLGGFENIVFARPEALCALVVALPVLLAHLYRRRRRRVAVAFVPLLREAIGPVHARGAWKRVREAMRLLCRIGAVAALVLAIAGPKPAQAATPIEDLVIVLDADETTYCREPEGGPLEGATRFERELALAKAHTLARSAGRVGVVLAGATPRTLVAPTEDRLAVISRLVFPAVHSDIGRADLTAAVAVAREARLPERSLRVLILSSRDIPAAATGSDVSVEGAGTAEDDQGFVDASVTPNADGVNFDVRVVLVNRSSEAVRRTLERTMQSVDLVTSSVTDVGGAEEDSQTVDLPANAEIEVKLSVRADGRWPLSTWNLHLPDRPGEPRRYDAWSGNNYFYAGLRPRARPSVLVVHGNRPRPFVRALLDAMGDAIDRDASGFVPVSGLADARPRDVTIVDGVSVPAGSLRKGAWIFVAPFGDPSAASGLPFRVGREVREPLVWRSEVSDPLLRGVDLTTAYVAKASTIVGDGVRTLASVEGEAVVADGQRDGARWLAFGLDPDGSDLPIRAALPLLLANAIRRMGEMPKSPLKPFYRAGEPIAPLVEVGPTEFDGFRTTEKQRRRVDRWGPGDPLAPTPGESVLWATTFAAWATTSAGVTMPVAVNRLDRSFDIRPARPASPPPPPAPPPPEDEAARWLAWLLIGAGALLLIDLILGAIGKRFVALPAGSA